MKYDDASGTLTLRNLVVTHKSDVSLATQGMKTEKHATSDTLAAADCGIVHEVTDDAAVITLPATAAGLTFTIMNGGEDGEVVATVSPNASDKIMGNGFTAADNKDAINTKATAKKGDFITLVGEGVDGWYVTAVKGTWARE